MLLMLLDKRLQSTEFDSVDPTAVLETNRTEPELGPPRVTLDMNVSRLSAIGGVEEQSVGSNPEDCRHCAAV